MYGEMTHSRKAKQIPLKLNRKIALLTARTFSHNSLSLSPDLGRLASFHPDKGGLSVAAHNAISAGLVSVRSRPLVNSEA